MTNAKDQMTSNGYIVSTGCDIPVDAPKENVLAFMDAVREYGPTRLGEKK
jgi:uroporphyrinogen-III decarboxylase